MAERDNSFGEHQRVPANGHSFQLPTNIVDVHHGKPVRLQVKVIVPVNDHPNYNFVGKLLGPKGNSLKWLQEQTQTKMAILGKGSMRNKEKERELRQLDDPKYSHLNEDLHVEITAFAPAPEAYKRISNALYEIKRFLVPDYYDDIRKQQLKELGVIGADLADTNSCKPFNSTSQTECLNVPLGLNRSNPSSYNGGTENGDICSMSPPFWTPNELSTNGIHGTKGTNS
ncbi:hypothetical protein RDWZM_009646 [Blomia tropicalis]|uniref:K Homology domain-containing protein n=1 Tax=Blomia tropicalis TaxID=40697 RepID=A0A9Q0M3T9_BLOTA|nr:hypothetical protein RDWZM_009646 [Blomia tropicalis]